MSLLTEQYPTGDMFVRAVLEKLPHAEIEYRWVVGGMWGGSCWNDDPADHPVSADDEPNNDMLDDVLTFVAPCITFLQYKRLGDVEDRSEYTENEYYGNYTEYKKKRLNLRKLYDRLVEIL